MARKLKSDENPAKGDAPSPPQRTPCPICKTLTDATTEHYPFCSRRCRQIDLGRWLQGDYVISRPIEQSDLEEE